MGVLRFDGTDDRIKWTTLASALANVSDGAWTLAILMKRAAVDNDDVGEGLSYLLSGSGAGTVQAGVSIRDSITNDNKIYTDLSAALFTASTFTSTASPYIFAISKGAGTVTPRLGWKLGSSGAWTHENFDGNLPDAAAATMLEIGAWQTGDPLDAWVGVVGWWEGAMSDANKEALDNNWRTSDWYNSAHGAPAFLAELNVTGTSVVDIMGNATSISVTGTTLDGAETLDSWNFNGTGAEVSSGVISYLNDWDLATHRIAPFTPGIAR